MVSSGGELIHHCVRCGAQSKKDRPKAVTALNVRSSSKADLTLKRRNVQFNPCRTFHPYAGLCIRHLSDVAEIA
jgi:hypothetical protein